MNTKRFSLVVIFSLLFFLGGCVRGNKWPPQTGTNLVPPTGSTLHAIIAADTNDNSIGASVKIDLKKLQSLMQNISRHTGLTLNPQYISGERLSRNSVLSAVNGISVAPDDVVFFFYNGHGHNPGNNDQWPAMSLDGGSLRLGEVRDVLDNKKPRLLITIADTCNGFSNRAFSPEPRDTEKSVNYRKLFVEYRGKIISSGSEPGQFSWGSSRFGGFYTNAFLNSLNKELATNEKPDWKTLMERANEPIRIGNGQVQQPQYVVKNEGGEDPCIPGRGTCPIPPGPPTPGPIHRETCISPSYPVGPNRKCCKTSMLRMNVGIWNND